MDQPLSKQQASKFPHTTLIFFLLVVLLMIQQSDCAGCSISIANCNNQCHWWDSTWCSSCATGYRNVAKTCCKELCASCTLDSVTCYSCRYGNCLSGINCLKCSSFVAECTSCTSCGTCATCTSPTYALVSSTLCSTCSSLMDNCIECSSSSACTKCVNNTLTVDSNLDPDQCVPCTNKLTNCATCGYPPFSSSLKCYSCFNNTYGVKNSDQKCYPCSTLMPNCLTCSSQTVCTECQATYAYSNSQCQPCSVLMTNCINCTVASQCTQCVDNTFTINSTNQCDVCSSIPTLAGCLTCSSTICLSCVDTSYTIDSSLCATCSSLMPGCLNCSSISACTVCTSDTYVLNTSSTKCDACSSILDKCLNCTSATTCIVCINTTYALNASKCVNCENLMNGCNQCNSSTICTSCVNNSYALNTSNNLCYACSAYMSFCKNCNNSTECIKCDGAPNVILIGQNCSQCGVVIPNCLNCTSATVCTFCSKYYGLSSRFSCILCANVMYGCIECYSTTVCTKCSFGQIVTNGCSSVPGCIAVRQIPSSSICTSCNTAHYASTPTDKGTCVCMKGHLAGQYCTQIIGCKNIIRNFNGEICTSCDIANYFNLQNNTCVCQQYYQASGQICVQICGDGKLIKLPCDDGNVFSGDGCSSICQIQKGYHCTGGAITKPSVCVYRGFVRLHPVCVYKQQGNTAQIILTINPSISNIQKSQTKIRFISSSNCSMDSFSFVGPNIILKISFFQTVEGSTVNIAIQYDKNYIVSPNDSTTVKLTQCKGDRLIYDPNIGQSNKTIIVMLTKVISLLALLVWFIGSYSHKMIGVETLHTFQLIFIPHALATRYFPVIIYFNELSNVLNFYKTKFTSSTPLTSTTQNRLNYSADFIYNDSVIALWQLIIFVVFTIIVIYDGLKSHFTKNGTQIQRKKQQNTCISILTKPQQFIYDFLVFPAFIGFFLNFILSLMIHSNAFQKEFSNEIFQTLVILFTGFSASFVFFWEWRQFFIKQQPIKQQLNHRLNYIPLYLTYFFVLCLVIEGSLTFLIPNSVFFLFGLTFVYTIMIMFYSPYHSWIHNIGLLINHLGVLLNLCWIISQEFIQLTRIEEQMIALVLVVWMFVILIFAIIRIIFQIRKTKCLKVQSKQQGKKQTKKSRDYEMQIMKAIEQQTSAKINSYFVQSQLIRYKKLQQQQLQQRKKEKIGYQLSNKLRFNQQRNHGLELFIRGQHLKQSLRISFNQQYPNQT